MALVGYVHERRDIPPSQPGSVQPSSRDHAALGGGQADALLRHARAGRYQNRPRQALGLDESVVRLLLNPDHRSHISQVEKALWAVGR